MVTATVPAWAQFDMVIIDPKFIGSFFAGAATASGAAGAATNCSTTFGIGLRARWISC